MSYDECGKYFTKRYLLSKYKKIKLGKNEMYTMLHGDTEQIHIFTKKPIENLFLIIDVYANFIKCNSFKINLIQKSPLKWEYNFREDGLELYEFKSSIYFDNSFEENDIYIFSVKHNVILIGDGTVKVIF